MSGSNVGFRKTPPSIAKLIPGADVRLDLDMGSLSDRSGYGNDGTPGASDVSVANGVYGVPARKFVGSTLSNVDCGNDVSTVFSGNVDYTLSAWENLRTTTWLSNKAPIVTRTSGVSNTGVALALSTGALPAVLDSGSATWRIGTLAVPVGTFCHVAASKKNDRYRLFVDGIETNVVTGSANVPSNAADRCYVGFEPVAARSFDGIVDHVNVFAQCLSPEQIYRVCQAASARPLFYDNFSQYPVDFTVRPAGAECGPYRNLAGVSSKIVLVDGTKYILGQTAAALSSVACTSPVDHAYGTWEVDMKETAGWGVSFLICCSVADAYSAASMNCYYISMNPVSNQLALYRISAGAIILQASYSVVLNSGTFYTLRCVRRIGGVFAVYIRGGVYTDFTLLPVVAGTNPTVENTHTTGKYTCAILGRNAGYIGNIKQWLTCRRPESSPWEFPNPLSGSSADVISAGKVWRSQLTAGILFIPKDMDYLNGRVGFRTIEEGVYKAAGTTHDTILAKEILGSAAATQYGYTIRITAAGRSQFIRTANGVETVVAETASGFISDAVEYQRRITRADDNRTIVYYKGGAYANWTVATDVFAGIYTEANYYVSDMDVGDRRSAPRFFNYVRNEP